jgi:tetratricopeptide (TPR) repeat protein
LYFDRTDSATSDRFEVNHAGYRMLQSACYRSSEGRLICTSCHDPHTAKVRADACQQCHARAHEGRETEQTGNCAACHMPRRAPADAIHTTMTDHKIVRRPAFTNPREEDPTPYTGPVVPFYTQADELSLRVANIRDSSPAAIATYRKFLSREPDDPAIGTALAKALLRNRSPVEAIRVLENVIRIDPRRTEARTHLGVAYGMAGRHRESRDTLQRAVAENPDDALAWTNLGITLEVLGDSRGAIESYSEAVRLQPDSSEARARRSRLSKR